MSQGTPDPKSLVLTQAEPAPPPDVTVPEPQRPEQRRTSEADFDPEILTEIKRLADRVGGLEKLQELVGALIRFQHQP